MTSNESSEAGTDKNGNDEQEDVRDPGLGKDDDEDSNCSHYRRGCSFVVSLVGTVFSTTCPPIKLHSITITILHLSGPLYIT